MGAAEDFVKESKTIKRKGIKELVEYLLVETDFFMAPASTKYHGSFDKGLIIHSLEVYDTAHQMNDGWSLGLDKESISICSLFHDICKANYYMKEKRNKKIDGAWHEVEVWAVNEKLPLGHGEKSVYLLQKFITLTDEEALAIRWHLGGFDPGFHFFWPSGEPAKQAFIQNRLVALIACADLFASYLLEES
jgi:putative nucleotidyltransferase with HDIG domain